MIRAAAALILLISLAGCAVCYKCTLQLPGVQDLLQQLMPGPEVPAKEE